MRDPNNLNQIEYNNDITVIKLDNIPKFDMYDYDLLDEKDFKKYMVDIEKIVRSSFEYRAMVNYLRDNIEMNKCSFYKNVSNIDNYKIKIEIHHEPLSLYDICQIVYNKRIFYNEELDVEIVAKEVMFLHYKLMIGLIPLAETVHELVHNSYLFIPINRVYGNYMDFINLYGDFFTPEQRDILERIIEYTKEYNSSIYNNHILDKKYIYVDLSGEYNFPKLQDVINDMNNRIKELKEKSSTNYSKPLIKIIKRDK